MNPTVIPHITITSCLSVTLVSSNWKKNKSCGSEVCLSAFRHGPFLRRQSISVCNTYVRALKWLQLHNSKDSDYFFPPQPTQGT